MPARNSQNPTRKENSFDKSYHSGNKTETRNSGTSGIAGICSSCQTPVPSKPGFRPSSLKCPKCGKPISK
ncbi:MAG: hypothetical protein KKH91_05560 [Elusimicrobia bacterium]|nr:hypothetical protein [Elusimicrobiota bacterium]MBU2614867.1 hypothetical protein [Elusimicrobiota bacterium]